MSSPALLQALRTKCGFEVRDVNQPSPKQMRLLGRIPQSRMGDMLLLIYALKTREEQGPGWTADISKNYFLLGGKVVFGWRIIFQSNEAFGEKHVSDICKVVNTTPNSSRREVTEAPLIGATANRNAQGANGKGAGYIGQVKIGPQMRGS